MTNENTPRPKPHPPIKRAPAPVKKPDAKQEPKKPYTPKAHLTQRPFTADELVEKLIKQTGVKNEPDRNGPFSDNALFTKLRKQAAKQEEDK